MQTEGPVVLISADGEWRALVTLLRPAEFELEAGPYGSWFVARAGRIPGIDRDLIFCHGGWGKIDAAASTQWVIGTLRPERIINLGTAGGFAGQVDEGDLIFVTRTLVYDIVERMGDAAAAIREYTTELGPPPPALVPHTKAGPVISADQDIDPARADELTRRYGALGADWESASIARVARKNRTPLILLRGVADIVSPDGSRTYGDPDDFEHRSRVLLPALLGLLPLCFR